MGEGDEESNDLEEETMPPNDDTPSIVLSFKVICRGEVLTVQEAIVGDTPPLKPPKNYNLKSKGPVLESTLEENKRALLRRILPPKKPASHPRLPLRGHLAKASRIARHITLLPKHR